MELTPNFNPRLFVTVVQICLKDRFVSSIVIQCDRATVYPLLVEQQQQRQSMMLEQMLYRQQQGRQIQPMQETTRNKTIKAAISQIHQTSRHSPSKSTMMRC